MLTLQIKQNKKIKFKLPAPKIKIFLFNSDRKKRRGKHHTNHSKLAFTVITRFCFWQWKSLWITLRNDKTRLFKISSEIKPHCFHYSVHVKIFFSLKFGSLVGTLNHRFHIVPPLFFFLFITPNLVLHNRRSNTSLERYILEIVKGGGK